MSHKEKRIRAITHIYYSNPKIQEAIFAFAKDREVVPSYMMEHFGKRPDALQYPADIINVVNKGATSFHASEEIWLDPLQINSDMTARELTDLRKSWDLLIDIDSPFLDYSKIAATLIIEELEKQGIVNYGLKFSGSKGFHIIVPAASFPEELEGQKTREMFPEWPRAISEYLMYKIRAKYNREITNLDINFKAVQERMNLSKEDLIAVACPTCGNQSQKGEQVTFRCTRCATQVERKDPKLTKRKLKCIDETCPGFLEVVDTKEYFFCPHCKTTSLSKTHASDKKVTYTRDSKESTYADNFKEEVAAEKVASLDLVLVASRHLFRMPYSLHEKTGLASIVLTKQDIASFAPKDANPLTVTIKEFYPKPSKPEAQQLLMAAISWKALRENREEKQLKKKYANYEKITVKGVSEDLFPRPIKKLLKGLQEGRKRGLFIILTFLRSLNFSPEYINTTVREWNKKNDPPLKEGYIKSQIDWHLKQQKQILPPNYQNESFYKDLKLFDAQSTPKEKNPIVEVLKKVRKSQQSH